MELDYAIMAERADGLTDGRYCVFGGDADCVETSNLPVPLQLAIVARFLLRPDEPLENHTVELAVTRPDGKRGVIGGPLSLETKRNEFDPDAPSGARVIINLIMLIHEQGTYALHIIGDGSDRKEIRLYVKLIESQDPKKAQSDGPVEIQNSK